MFSTWKFLFVLFTFHGVKFSNCFEIKPDILNILAEGFQGNQSLAGILLPILKTDFKSSSPNFLKIGEFLLKYILQLDKSECTKDMEWLIKSALSGEYWALLMLDSYGKFGDGIFEGNLIWPGSYSNCRKIQVPRSIAYKETVLSGQYCWAKFELGESIKEVVKLTNISVPIKLQVGLCIPDSCSAEEIESTVNVISKLFPLDKFLNISETICISNAKSKWTEKSAIASLIVISLIIIMLIVGTIYDVAQYQRKNVTTLKYSLFINNPTTEEDSESNESIELIEKGENGEFILENGKSNLKIVSSTRSFTGTCGEICRFFSVYSNGAKILSLSSESEMIRCLSGIRFFSMTWIILGHLCYFQSIFIDNPKYILELQGTFLFQLPSQAILSVDTFFVLSGFLLAYLFCKHYEENNGKISWLKFYAHRYWRLTPMYLLVLLVMKDILSMCFGDGPFWYLYGFEEEKCNKNWWWNVLFINNFFPLKDMCLPYSWYLANEMQFYILSPLLLIPLAKKSYRLSITIAGSFLLISSVTSGTLANYYKISAEFDLTKYASNSEEYNNFFNNLYDKPYCRIGPYVIGMICGWLLNETRSKFKMKKRWVIFVWILAFICNFSVMFGVYITHPSEIASTLFWTLSRIAWSLGLCWLIFACCTGNGGIINSFLSWPIWQPFGRLTYSVYLIHYILLETYFYRLESIGRFTEVSVIFNQFAFVVGSYLCGLIVSLSFESPFLAMERFLLKRKS